MMKSQSAHALIKKLILSAGVAGAMVAAGAVIESPIARAAYPERTPGTFECRNSLDPQCENPPRAIESESWRSLNNPGPEFSEAPRVPLEPERGNRQCFNNQNVVLCGNPIRYTVADPEAWPTYFPESR
ncbi:hypothetical protein [Leptolyngbya ohadii]|uniref:hypothetical protein n=1 Tax=Leptolyngbya ohadii TaxID=1962290 RepID=UPI000B5A08E7|nr:hypothetical protein [Leptolyngbya ohadii]